MERPLNQGAIEQLRLDADINEYHRHLNRLLRFGLARIQEAGGTRNDVRTEQGERAVNALREFERRVGADAAQIVYNGSLGPNSIPLFLRICGQPREADWDHRRISYSPAEIGRLGLFLPRTIEGLSAIDNLN